MLGRDALGGELDGRRRPLPVPARQSDPAAMRFEQAAGERQAEPNSYLRGPQILMQLRERLEDKREIGRRGPDSGLRHVQMQAARSTAVATTKSHPAAPSAN